MAATIQGEIRIGPNHQARVPPLINGHCEEPTRETLVWKPDRLPDTDLLMFLRAARSMAAFAGMCDGGSSEDGFLAASRDQTTSTAMEALHQNAYDTGRALHDLVKKPIGHTIEKTWTEDDIKKFVRGLKQHGKNFFRIRRDLLSHKETCDLIEFYYLWKKSPAAVTHRPRQRPRRGQMLRRGKAGAGKAARATPSENSSTSDSDSGCEDSDDNSNLSGPCRHCEAAVAKEWHRVDKEGTVLCTDCKLHFDEARNDVIRANDPDHMAIENKPPALALENSADHAPPPAKRPRTSEPAASPAILAPPPPLIPALVNTPTTPAAPLDIPVSKNSSDPITAITSATQSALNQSLPNIRSPVANNATPSSAGVAAAGEAIIKQETKVKAKEEENSESGEGNGTGQDEFVNMLSSAGNKGLDPKIDDTECHRSANAIFRRHWNRGDNSCARTDLIYVPVPRLSSNAVIRSHHDTGNVTKEKSPVRASATTAAAPPGGDVRRISSTSVNPGPPPPGSNLDPSLTALQRLRDYASAATGSFGVGEGPPGGVGDPRMKPGVDVMPMSRASPAMMQPPPLQYTTGAQAMMMQRPPMPTMAQMPPYEMMAGQQHFADALAAERWFAAEHNRMQWERAAAMNPQAANDMAVRLQLERMMAGSMHLTHTHVSSAHTHLHIHAARAAAAMHQNPVMGGFSPGAAWAAAAAAARPGGPGSLEAFQAANMLYGGPPPQQSYPPPPGFLGPHMMDSMAAERLAQQQHLLEFIHQRQMMQDRE